MISRHKFLYTTSLNSTCHKQLIVQIKLLSRARYPKKSQCKGVEDNDTVAFRIKIRRVSRQRFDRPQGKPPRQVERETQDGPRGWLELAINSRMGRPAIKAITRGFLTPSPCIPTPILNDKGQRHTSLTRRVGGVANSRVRTPKHPPPERPDRSPSSRTLSRPLTSRAHPYRHFAGRIF